jgi:hypothetical protein
VLKLSARRVNHGTTIGPDEQCDATVKRHSATGSGAPRRGMYAVSTSNRAGDLLGNSPSDGIQKRRERRP